ncbi:MAG TPA: hypothetical protein VJ377_00180 [Dehalococcoidales bacterium]|nr:MAG: hypothetical protein A2Z05_04320 [Chloroflexi bacterium RBG_16_60_22]HJX11927.1 hypothetical protein [Dehalococcoidales bacterium]
MAEKRNAKYYVFKDKPDFKPPAWEHLTSPGFTRRLAYIDEETVPGAEFGCESLWLLPGGKSREGRKMMDAHASPHGTFIGFFGYNYEDIHDLGAEIEFHIGGEKHTIKKSFAAFIPEGLEHGPLIIRNIRRPVFHFIARPCGEGIGKKYA